MKWLVVLGAVLALGAALLFMRGAAVDEPQAPTAALPSMPASAQAPALATAPRPAAVTAQPWRRFELRGVLFQPNDVAASQALLSVDAQAVQVFRRGDELLPGWTLQSLQADHVVVASGSQQHRLDVQLAPAPQALAAAGAASANANANAIKEVPLPGFIPSATPSSPRPTPSVETNRRFLQDRQNQLSGAAR